MNEIPIIIFHLGNQEYVNIALKQASKYNNNIIMINDYDDMFNDISGVKCVSYKKYNTYSDKFIALYKHFSTNSYQIEFLCIIRWMCVYEYMKQHNICRAFICDSDVLIYDNISDINNKYLYKYNFMLCSSPSKNLTGGQSIWNFEDLQKFIIFIFKFYNTQISNIEEWSNTYSECGGICDMTLLYYFAHNKEKFIGLRLPNYPEFKSDLTQIFNNEFTFDLHLASEGNHSYPNDYEMADTGNKKIKYIDGKPYCFCKRLNKYIRFILLHFQGRNKVYIKKYYEAGNLIS